MVTAGKPQRIRRSGRRKGRRALDAADVAIMQELQRDARLDSVVLGQRLGLPSALVLRRRRQLEAWGVMRTTAVLNSRVLGYPISALVAITVPYGELEEVCDRLAQVAWAQSVMAATGAFNLFLVARARSLEGLHESMREMAATFPEIQSMQIFIGTDVPTHNDSGPDIEVLERLLPLRVRVEGD